MGDLAERITSLSAKKRELLLKHLDKEKGRKEERVRPRGTDSQSVPLSFAQQRLWFLEQLNPGNPSYNNHFALVLKGELQVTAVEEALNEIVRRHEILRTTFPGLNGSPIQVIAPGLRPTVPLVHVRGGESDVRHSIALDLATIEIQRPFDLSRGPLLRVVLLNLDDREHVFVLTTHHIVSDGWSAAIFSNELIKLYDCFHQGKPSPFPELAIQYADFACWQRNWLLGDRLDEQLLYWKTQLYELPIFHLPINRSRPVIRSNKGGAETIELSPEVSDSLKKLGQQEGATFFILLLAAFKALLYRYTGQNEVILGIPAANRNRVEIEGLIGFFVNTLVLRTRLSGSLRFRDLVVRVRETALGAYAHQDLPFERLVEELQPERSLSHNPIFQIMCTLQSASNSAINPAGVNIHPITVSGESAKFGLTLNMFDKPGGLSMTLGYSSDLFDATMIRRMCAHLGTLLEEIIMDVDRPLSGIRLMSDKEHQQVTVEWNDTRREYALDRCLHELVEKQVDAKPDRIAVVHEEGQISYGKLDIQANKIANHLVRRGLGVERRVGICLERSMGTVLSALGVLKAGGVCVPLDRGYPAKRLGEMLEDSRANLIVVNGETRGVIEREGCEEIDLDEESEVIREESGRRPALDRDSEGAAYELYTSGSTGRPKGVILTHRGLVNRILGGQENFELEEDDRVMQKAPYSFDASIWETYWPLSVGAMSALARAGGQRDSRYLIREIEEKRITVMHFVPGMLRVVLGEDGIERSESLREVFCGGEVLGEELVRRYRENVRGELYNQYGPTETTVNATYWNCECVRKGRSVPIGRPYPGVRVYVMDEEMEAMPVGVEGEIYIGGEGVTRGYVGGSDQTAERYLPDPNGSEGGRVYRTGDLGRWAEEGLLEIGGRRDNQVKVRGYRVEPGEIEEELKRKEGIKESAVIAREDRRGGKMLVAYVVGEEGEEVKQEEVKRYLRGRIPEYLVPSVIVKVGELALTANGKVDRRRLEEMELDRSGEEGKEEGREKRPVEEVIGGIWSEVLGVEEVGLSENFFDIGGHSLLATQVVSRMREALNVEVELRAIFEEPTLEGLSRVVEDKMARTGGAQWKKIEPVSREGKLRLSYGQQRLWFLDQMEPGNAFYNVPSGVRLQGELDEKALQKSFSEVVRRHEALRTVFREEEGKAVQVIKGAQEVRLPVIDLREMEEERGREESSRISEEEGREAFDLSKGPLLRLKLIRETDTSQVLLMTMHHIISDGWSSGVLIGEVEQMYEGYTEGGEVELEELEIQYCDYAEWQREMLRGEVIERELRYWRDRMEGAPGVLELPTDKGRPAVQSYRGGSYGMRLEEELTGGIKRLSRKEGATLFMTMLSAFKVLLMRYSGQTDIVVGTPIANRNRRETEGLIGFFVNMLVMRTKIGGGDSFREVIRKVREGALGAYAHQDLPFERLVEDLQPERSLSHSPLFQVIMVVHNAPTRGRGVVKGLKMSGVGSRSGTTKYDVTLEVVDEGGRLNVGMSYNRDLYEDESIRRMSVHLCRVIEAAVEDVEQEVGRVRMLSEWEEQQIEEEWNDTREENEEEVWIQGMFERQVEETPDRVALVRGGEHLSYWEVNLEANKLGHYLREQGVGAERTVGVCTGRTAEMVIGILAVLKAGGAYVPMDPGYPKERLRYMLEDCKAEIVVVDAVGREEIGTWEWKKMVVDMEEEREEINRCSGRNVEGWAVGENVAYIIYTSGSTGEPKGVAIQHGSAAEMVRWSQGVYGRKELSRVAATTSMSFDLSVYEIFVTLASGGAVVIMKNAMELADKVEEEQVSLINTVPSVIGDIAEGKIGGSVEVVNVAGEVLTRKIVEKMEAQGAGKRVYNLYGPTEDTTYSTYEEVRMGTKERPTIGRPIRNTEVYVLSGEEELAPIGVTGELYISGKGLSRGYVNRGDLTASRYVPSRNGSGAGKRMYRTGDRCRYLGDGRIEFIGRADNQVKVRGYRVEPGEIEEELKRKEGIKESAVIAREDRRGGKMLVAYVVGEEGEEVKQEEVKRYLRGRIPEYLVPSVIVKVGELALTANGKVDRRRLEEMELDRSGEEGKEEGREKRPVEEVIGGIWSEVLGVEEVGLSENFFDIGGHSLLATQVVSRMREALNVEVELRAIFEEPTLEGLSRVVEDKMARTGGAQWKKIEPVSREGKLRLSYGQQRLWFLDQMEPGNAFYNVPSGVRLQGELDEKALQKSFSEVVRRHEALRTVFREEEGKAVQVIKGAQEVRLPVIDLREMEEERGREESSRISEEEGREAFDLSKGPLLRLKLIRETDTSQVLLMTMHHIISDGWSSGVLIGEVEQMYEGYTEGGEVELEELEIQYCDYAEWQREMLRGEVIERELRYWRDRMEGAPGVLELPTDKGRPAVQSYRGGSYGMRLEEELTGGIKRLSRKEGATLFMTMLSAFKVLLMRYSGQTDIVVGTPIANRNRRETEGLIGFFVNMLVMRTKIGGGDSFREVIRKVREGALGAYAHQDLPFERLVEDLQPERSLSHSPLFQVIMVVHNAPTRGRGVVKGLKMSGVGSRSGTTKYDVTLEVVDEGGRLNVGMSYNRDLYEDESIRRMSVHLCRVIEAAVEDVEQEVGRVRMLSEWEEQQIEEEWNDTREENEEEVWIQGMFERQVEETPDRVALVRGGEHLSYWEVNLEANKLGHYLREQGVGAERTVGVCTGRTAEMVIGILAVLKAGGAYVPMDPGYPKERLRYMLEDCKAEIVVVDAVGREEIGTWEWKKMVVDMEEEREEINRCSGRNVEGWAVGENVAYIIYTSGSTGEPKGVAIQHGSAAEMVRWSQGVYGRKELSRVAATTSMSFDLSVYEIFVTLASGGAVVIMKNAMELADKVEEEQVSLINTVPSVIGDIAEGKIGGSVEVVNVAGEVLTRKIVEKMEAQGAGKRVYNLYGPTEDTTYSTYEEVRMGTKERPTIGRPIRNTEVYVLSGEEELAPIGVTGELYISGKGLSRGYVNRGDLTASRYVPSRNGSGAGKRMYRTGDRCRYLGDGRIEFIGRADNQVKVRGYRVEPGEIESVLMQHPAVAEAVVIDWTDSKGIKALAAYVVDKPNENISPVELSDYLKNKLPQYLIPGHFIKLQSLPITPNGKTDRRALASPGRNGIQRTSKNISPRNDIEIRLAAIFSEVLGREGIGMTDDFFELGGHSLLTIQLVSAIERTFGYRIPLHELFKNGVRIESLAGYLLNHCAKAQPQSSCLVPVRKAGNRRPFFCVHPASGQVLCFVDLVRNLSGDRPFYGFQSQTCNHGDLGIEPIASRYIEEMRSIQPRGPYLLGGYSMGGLVAFEMARQLARTGDEISLLALIDSAIPGSQSIPGEDDDGRLIQWFVRDLALPIESLNIEWDQLMNLSTEDALGRLLEMAKQAGLVPDYIGLEWMNQLYQVFKDNIEAMRGYEPGLHSGSLLYFRASEQSASSADQRMRTWNALATGGVESFVIPGSHYSIMREPNVKVLGQQLDACILKIEEETQ
jgi:amino acid adenylation domain-containing protein